MVMNFPSIENGYRRSVVGDHCEIYDLEQAVWFVNKVSEIPFTVNHLLKSAFDNSHPRILCKVIDDIGLIHQRTEFDRDSEVLISHTIQESIECFSGFFRVDESCGGREFLKGIAYSDKPTVGISSIVKEYSNSDVEEFAICDTEYDCFMSNLLLQHQWEDSKYGYGEPDYISAGEYFPPLSTLYIEKTALELFIDVFVSSSSVMVEPESVISGKSREPVKESTRDRNKKMQSRAVELKRRHPKKTKIEISNLLESEFPATAANIVRIIKLPK